MAPNGDKERPYSHQETRLIQRSWHPPSKKPNGGDRNLPPPGSHQSAATP